MRSIGISIVCCLCPLLAFASDAEVAKTRIELAPVFFESAAGPGVLQTSIAWGAIRVTVHDEDWVGVSAEVTGGVTVEPVVRGSGIELRVNAGDGFHSIEMELRVPRATSVGLEVRRGGEVLVDGVGGTVEVSNRNGSVVLDGLRASAVVNARNGSITAAFDRVDHEAAMAFAALNGSVDVTLPPGTAADLRVRYNRGGIESDFEIEDATGTGPATADVSGLDPRQTRVLHGTINGGGPRYYFETANGTVYLRRGA